MPQFLVRDGRLVVALDTGRRSVERPVDAAGHMRTRVNLLAPPEVRAAATAGDSIGFTGHAAVFNKRTWIGSRSWGFWEEVSTGAFKKTITEADIRFLINHDPNYVLARNKSETLRLSEDSVGLAVDADMAPTTYAADLAVLLERGDVSQMSFAFDTVPGGSEWSLAEDGNELWTHYQLRLWDVSVVTYPAYEETDAGLRAWAFDRAVGELGLTSDQVRQLIIGADDSVRTLLRQAVKPVGERGAEPVSLPEGAQARAIEPEPASLDRSEPEQATEDAAVEEAAEQIETVEAVESTPPAETTGEESPPAETTGVANNNERHALLRRRRMEMHAHEMKEVA